MTDIFQVISNKVRQSKFSILIFIFAAIMFFIGLNHFYEDYLAGLHGIHTLEDMYDLRFVVKDFTYTTMALSPQIAQIVFGFAFLLDVKKNKHYLAIAGVFFLMDFVPDVWYRSNGDPLESFIKFIVVSFMTFSFFTIGSELFITVGGGMLLEMFKPTFNQLFDLIGVKFRFNVSNESNRSAFKSERSNVQTFVQERSVQTFSPVEERVKQYYISQSRKGSAPSYNDIVKNVPGINSKSQVKPILVKLGLIKD